MNLIESTSSIKIINDINVTVPTSMQLMTPYVLCEQNDWFEDEIKFLRTFIKPGMQILDIGANYGLYTTLTLAKIIGTEGKIWAFEPTSSTSACLKQSIVDNNFNNIELIQAGLSDRIKKAKLFTTPNSEINSLSKELASGSLYETISLLTLDHCAKKYHWEDIDFIKLDAEGEESNILKKSKTFLSSESPLVMFELKHGKNVNLPLISQFKNLGYESYRLIPGLNVLVPFNHEEPFDGYLLNLFCCKKDKAAILKASQIIVNQNENLHCPPGFEIVKDYLAQFAFGIAINNLIDSNSKISKDYLEILTQYILAYSDSASASEKIGHLMAALSRIRSILKNGEQRIEYLTTFARIAFDAGERSLGVNILRYLIDKYHNNLDFEITEPVLPASSKYDAIEPNNNIKELLFSSILEQYIIKHAFSSYFTRCKVLPLFQMLREMNLLDEEMQRREEMIKNCFRS